MTWFYPPETDCPSALEPVALILASCLPSQSSTPDALSNGKIIRGNPSSQDSAPDTSPPPRSGTTSQPSTPDPSGVRSTQCLPDTHASHSAQRGSEKGKTTPDTYGRTSPASLPSYGPDGSFLKTSQDTFHLASIPCCEKYGTWAIRLRLAYSQRRKSVQVMNGSGCSSWPTAKAVTGGANSQRKARGAGGADLQEAAQNWPTPMAGTSAQNGNSAAGNPDFSRKAEELAQQQWFTPNVPNGGRTLKPGTSPTGMTPEGVKRQVGLENQAAMWKTPSAQEPGVEHRPRVNADGTPWTGGERAYDQETGRLVQTGLPQMVKANQHLWTTPKAHDVTMRGAGQTPTAKAGNACLARDAQMWSTPRGSDGEKGGPNMAFGAGGTPLPAQAAKWSTPASRDHKGENSADHLENGTGRLHLDHLPNAVAFLFSRPDQETPQHGATLSDLLRIWRPLRASVIASHGRATWRRLMKARDKRRLNPGFVEWLMNWPPGHARCDCSATEFAHWQRHMRSALSRQPMASGPWIWKPPAPEVETMQLDMFGGEA